jgi:hypothetical protein
LFEDGIETVTAESNLKFGSLFITLSPSHRSLPAVEFSKTTCSPIKQIDALALQGFVPNSAAVVVHCLIL